MKKNLEIIVVAEEDVNIRLDSFVSSKCEHIPSRSFAQRLIQNLLVFVDEKVEKPSLKLKKGQIVKIDFSFLIENKLIQGEKIPLEIFYEDEHLIVLNKPSGMVVHPGAGVYHGTLVNAILAHCGSIQLPSLGEKHRAGIVHRLDKDTSGVMVVAKSQLALTRLSQQFASHKQVRHYLAVTYGVPSSSEGLIETWHGRDPKNRVKFSCLPDGQGKKAKLSYKIEEKLTENEFCLVRCELFTGRTHQIRVQMKTVSSGIVGDSLYSRIPEKLKKNNQLYSFLSKNIKRQLLHACFLEFIHPHTQEKMSFISPLPNDFQSTLTYLRSPKCIQNN